MTKTVERAENRRAVRKSTFWTREKIADLIKLYKQHECLWNHFSASYKCKEQRNKALSDICSKLDVNKYDVGKKVHNLRNQFNAEMKKLERRIEEAGGEGKKYRCRWEHFESLMFLRDIIEPRPGYQLNKIQLKVNYNSEDDTTTNTEKNFTQYKTFEEITAIDDDDEDTIGEDVLIANELQQIEYESNESIVSDNKKFKTSANTALLSTPTNATLEVTTLSNQTQTTTKSINASGHIEQHSQPTFIKSIDETQEATVQYQSNNQGSAGGIVGISMNSSANLERQPRDQWDAFGELIAIEFRNLNSDSSRKKLKRKIMIAMLEVGEEDDKQ